MAQSLNATFFAFKKRDRSGVLTRASLAFLALATLVLAAFIALNIQFIGPVLNWYGALLGTAAKGGAPSAAMMTPPAGLAIFFLSLFPFMFVIYVLAASYEAACLKWLIRGETGGVMGLSLGADTWRVYLTYWIWFLLNMAFSIVSGIITGVLVFGALAASGSNGDLTMSGSMLVASFVIRLIIYVVLIYFAVRFAPAAAVSVGRRQFAFFDAWKVTKDRFWALFGSFLIVFVIVFAVAVVLGMIAFSVAFAGAWPTLASLGSNPDSQQVSAAFTALFTPQSLIFMFGTYIVFLALSLALYVLYFGINARALIAAAEDGKVQVPGIGVAQQFE